MHRNEHGLIQLIALVVTLVGVAAGVYLSQKTQIFRPRASVDEAPQKPGVGFYFKTEKEAFKKDEEATVTLYARSDPDYSNLFVAKISFPKDLLEIQSISQSNDFIKNWIDPSDPEKAGNEANQSGKLTVAGGVPNPGYQSLYGQPGPKMAEIKFKALKEAGSAQITFDEDSSVFRNSDNADLLSEPSSADKNYAILKKGVTLNIGLTTVIDDGKQLPPNGVINLTYNLQSGRNLIGIPAATSLTEDQLKIQTQNKCTTMEADSGNDESSLQITYKNVSTIYGGKAYFITCSSPVTVTIGGTNPINDFSLVGRPYQLISLPRSYNNSGKKAEDVLKEVESLGVKCGVLNRWKNGGWEPHIKNGPSNFDVSDLEGYALERCSSSGAYDIKAQNKQTNITCKLNDQNCYYKSVVVPFNRIQKPLYQTTIWTTSNSPKIMTYTYEAGQETSDKTVIEKVIQPGEEAINTLVKVVPPQSVGKYKATFYIDGKTCNQKTTPTDCTFYGGSSLEVNIEVVDKPSSSPPLLPSPSTAPKPAVTQINMDINGDGKVGSSTKSDGSKDKSEFYKDTAKFNSSFNPQCSKDQNTTAAPKGDLNGDSCINSVDWSLYRNEAFKNGWI